MNRFTRSQKFVLHWIFVATTLLGMGFACVPAEGPKTGGGGTSGGGGGTGGGGQGQTSATFTQIGPKFGIVSNIQFHPTRANEAWASGDDGSGLYKSVDGGATWNLVSTGSLNQSTYSLRFDPTNPNRIYAPSHFGRGMLRSTDGGATWLASQAGLPVSGDVSQKIGDLAVNPSSPNIVVAATDDGFYRSTDFGANFSKIPLTGVSGTDDCRTLLYTYISSTLVLFLGKGDGVMVYSTDSGTTWTPALPAGLALADIEISNFHLYLVYKTGLIHRYPLPFGSAGPTTINDPSSGIYNSNAISLIVKPGNTSSNDVLYVGTSGQSTIAQSRWGLFRSTNSGGSWTRLSSGVMDSNYVFSVAVDPYDSNRILTGSTNGRGILRTTDGGNSWAYANQSVFATSSLGTTQDPSNHLHLLTSVTAGGGLGVGYESYDGGQTWSLLSDPTEDDGVSSFYVDPRSSNRLLAGAYRKGLWRIDRGVSPTWTQILVAPTNHRVDRIVSAGGNAVYILTLNDDIGTGNLYYSADPYNDGGGLGGLVQRTGFQTFNISVHPTVAGQAIVAASDNVHSTTNYFQTRTGLGLSSFAAAEGGFCAVSINKTTPSEVVVGGCAGGIYRTTNYSASGVGIVWTKLNSAFQSVFIRDVHVTTRNNRSVIYALATHVDSYFKANSTIGIYRTLDNGANWTSLTNGAFPSNIGWKFAPDLRSPNNRFLVSLWGGGLLDLSDSE